VITRRALLIYNFGIALILVVVGFVSVYAVEALQQPSRLTEMPTFDADSRQAVEQQKDIEPLRARALFYFDLARELKKARSVDTTRLFYDARTLAIMVAGLFALAGVMLLVLPDPTKPSPSPTI
jgi:hypothetical protein